MDFKFLPNTKTKPWDVPMQISEDTAWKEEVATTRKVLVLKVNLPALFLSLFLRGGSIRKFMLSGRSYCLWKYNVVTTNITVLLPY